VTRGPVVRLGHNEKVVLAELRKRLAAGTDMPFEVAVETVKRLVNGASDRLYRNATRALTSLAEKGLIKSEGGIVSIAPVGMSPSSQPIVIPPPPGPAPVSAAPVTSEPTPDPPTVRPPVADGLRHGQRKLTVPPDVVREIT